MENEQFNLSDTAIEPTKMPIKKAFTIVGFALSLSIIALNLVSYVGVGLIYRYLPDVYNSDYFQFGASTIPLMLIAMPVFFGVMCLIPTVKTSYKEKLSIGMLAKITVIGYVVMIILNLVSSVLNMIISGATGLPATNPIEFIQDTGIWPVILFSVILSPIVEEIMFRYILINKLRGNFHLGICLWTIPWQPLSDALCLCDRRCFCRSLLQNRQVDISNYTAYSVQFYRRSFAAWYAVRKPNLHGALWHCFGCNHADRLHFRHYYSL